MPDLPTRADYYAIGAADVLARSQARSPQFRIAEEAIRTEGSEINIYLSSGSAMAEEVTRQLGMRIAALFLDGASGALLDRLVADRFSPDIVRKGATPAVDNVQLTRSSGGLLGGTIPVGFVFASTSGQQFETTAIAAVPAGALGPITVPVRARVAGSAGNVAAGTITTFVSTAFDPLLQVTNAEPAAGGDEQETDTSLRGRARSFFRGLRRGVVGAIEFGALRVPGVRQAVAIEELDQFGEQTGRVSLVIADANGQSNAALVDAVRNALFDFRAAGIIVDIVSGVPTYVPIVLRLRFSAGVDTTAAFAQVVSAVVAQVNALQPGATLPVSLIFAAARSIPGVIVLGDAIVAPVGDIVPPSNGVLRTTTALVTEAPVV